MNFITKTEFVADLKQITEDFQAVLTQTGFSPSGQIGLTHRPGAENKWYDGIGSLYDFESKKFLANENDFDVWNDLVPEYTKKIVQDLSTVFKFKIGRVRYMRLKSKNGLTVHSDRETRFHFVIQSNPKSYMLLAESNDKVDIQGWHIPCDGHFYHVDTTREHSVYNGGAEDRIHLVICAV